MGAPVEHISSRIFIVRGQRIMLDTDLAGLYGVSTSALIQAVKRNLGRFPPDFMFQLTEQELRDLRSQSVISKPRDNSTIWSDGLATTTERSRTSCAPSGISPLLVHPRSAGSDSFSRQRRKGD